MTQGWRWKLLAVLLAPLLVQGCLRATQLERIGAEIAWQHPEARFEREISVSIGSLPMGFARWVVGLAGEDAREAKAYLDGVSRIEFVIYKVRGLGRLHRTETPNIIESLIEDRGWEMIVKAREESELAWILYREEDGRVRDLLITAIDGEEMVLIKVSGRLDRVFEQALADHHGLTDMVGRGGR